MEVEQWRTEIRGEKPDEGVRVFSLLVREWASANIGLRARKERVDARASSRML